MFDQRKDLDYSVIKLRSSYLCAQLDEYIRQIIKKIAYIDYLINYFSRLKPDEMNPKLRNVLRVCVYDLIYVRSSQLDIIKEAVEFSELCLDSNKTKFVNAILRNLKRELTSLPQPSKKDQLAFLSVMLSYPQWMIERWVKILRRDVITFLKANNMSSMVGIRVNTLRTSRNNFILRLKKLNIEYKECPYNKTFFYVSSLLPIIKRDWIDKGICQVFDTAEGFSVMVLDIQGHENIYDFFPGNGQKAIYMASLLKNGGKATIFGESEEQLKKLSDIALKANAENIHVISYNYSHLNLGKADAIVIHPPSSCSGQFNQYPNFRWKLKDKNDLNALVQMQSDYLDKATDYLKVGGKLVYTVSSMEPEETKLQIKSFLLRHKNFKIESLEGLIPEKLLLPNDPYYYHTLPWKDDYEGYFGVLFKKIAE